MASLGYEFEPGRSQKKQLSGINRGQLGPMANEALRVLSMRLPQILGGSPMAPEELMRPRVGGTPGMSAVGGGGMTGGLMPPSLPTAGPAGGSAGTAQFTGASGGAGGGMPGLAQLISGAFGPPSITPGSPAQGSMPMEPQPSMPQYPKKSGAGIGGSAGRRRM